MMMSASLLGFSPLLLYSVVRLLQTQLTCPLSTTTWFPPPDVPPPLALDVCLLDQTMPCPLSILHSRFCSSASRGRPPDSLLLKDTSCLGNLCRLTPPILWNTLLCYCSAYFSSNMIEVGFTLAMDHRGKFTYHSSDSGLHGLMILSLGSSNTITFFPHVVSSWLVRTRTLFSLKFIILMFIGKGSVSNFIFCLSPNVKRPSFSADCT
jgi:hypothetical protein